MACCIVSLRLRRWLLKQLTKRQQLAAAAKQDVAHSGSVVQLCGELHVVCLLAVVMFVCNGVALPC